VHRELVTGGTRVGKKRIARLMREEGLVGRRPRRFVRTTQARAGDPVAPNRLARQFGVDQVAGPDRVWVSDITYVPTREGWLFLAIVLDLASRRVVGWAMRETLEEDLALAALRMALAARRPRPGLLHHSDRGSQPGLNWSSQQRLWVWNLRTDPAPRLVFSSRGFCEAWC
jgi:transposase InsO family protein